MFKWLDKIEHELDYGKKFSPIHFIVSIMIIMGGYSAFMIIYAIHIAIHRS